MDIKKTAYKISYGMCHIAILKKFSCMPVLQNCHSTINRGTLRNSRWLLFWRCYGYWYPFPRFSMLRINMLHGRYLVRRMSLHFFKYRCLLIQYYAHKELVASRLDEKKGPNSNVQNEFQEFLPLARRTNHVATHHAMKMAHAASRRDQGLI